ncbi:hypothetical protein N7470_007177 [Penicillium chermesinum]|nr:hypothetical protein N7470_007177 [Penicillium chermesinum]
MPSVTEVSVNLVLSIAILVVSRFLWSYLRSPLRSFPGPPVAAFTNVWRMMDVFKGRCDITHNALHRKYGSAVRLGPNLLSLSDPDVVSQVYNTKTPWQKSDMYFPNDVLVDGIRYSNLFSTRDEKWHSTFVRPIKSLYSMSKVQDMEPGLDVTIALFFEKLRERFVKTGNVCDMSEYLNFFAWDAMSEITFSQNLGILEAGWDYRGFLKRSNRTLDYFASISQLPILDHLLDKNPVMRIGPPTFIWANIFSVEQLQKRLAAGGIKESGHVDYLDRFLEAKEKHPELVDDNTIILWLLSNVLAGSDSTAGAISFALNSGPPTYRSPPTWKELQGLTYFDAVMREGVRVGGGVGLILERVVPKGGFHLPDGRFVPEGTVVGVNPWVMNRCEAVYGGDIESFIPERWLQNPGERDEDYERRFSKMKATDFSFGGGPRVCLGRYVSRLESYKLVAALFTHFDREGQALWAVKLCRRAFKLSLGEFQSVAATMVRQLKHHEKKLLRKVDFHTYKSDGNHREHQVSQRYLLQDPMDYKKYSQLCGSMRSLAHKLSQLDPDSDPVRRKLESELLDKLWRMGILKQSREQGAGLSRVEREVTVSAFCRRRLAVLMVRSGMVETIKAATTFIEQGHVRVGTEVVTDPAYLVTRNMEDFVTWVDSSKIKRNIMRYRDKMDDFDLM